MFNHSSTRILESLIQFGNHHAFVSLSETEKPMLKISIQHDPDIATMKVEGKIVGAWASELQHVWRDLWVPIEQKQLRLDLREVTFVDNKGMQVLREIVGTTGAKILADSPLSQYFAEQAKRGIEPNLKKEN